MRALLDECVTRRIKRDFPGHEVHTVEEAGMKGFKNGELLHSASGRYDVLVRVDKIIPYQQNVKSLTIAILILSAKRNAYDSLRPLMPEALEALKQISPGDVIIIGESESN